MLRPPPRSARPATLFPYTPRCLSDLPAIEEEMLRIFARDDPLIREVWTRDDVREFFVKSGETFKAEWVLELPADEAITMYRSGEWIDLCRGPHLEIGRASCRERVCQYV